MGVKRAMMGVKRAMMGVKRAMGVVDGATLSRVKSTKIAWLLFF